MLAIINYGAGNLRSVQKACEYIGETAVITDNPNEILKADRVILPGVGSFGSCMSAIRNAGLVDCIHEVIDNGTPFLGICLGLQLLFERSDEAPGVEGLGVLKGDILKLPDKEGYKIPHMGWNSLDFPREGRLFKGLGEHPYVYFVHSYYLKAKNPEDVAASTFYSTQIHASVEHGNVFACQFHPEKSSEVGLKILKNFIDLEV